MKIEKLRRRTFAKIKKIRFSIYEHFGKETNETKSVLIDPIFLNYNYSGSKVN